MSDPASRLVVVTQSHRHASARPAGPAVNRPAVTHATAAASGTEPAALTGSPGGAARRVALRLNPRRPEAVDVAAAFVEGVSRAGIECLVESQWLQPLGDRVPEAVLLDLDDTGAHEGVELFVVFGGDGTILRGAEWAIEHDVPLLGVNLGHVGFLAELEPSDTDSLVTRVVAGDYDIERRLVLAIRVTDPVGGREWTSIAVNEVSLEKAARERMVEVLASVDGRPVSRWHCDGVLVSTPTGSTAYAFSAGGPVIWPDVEAMLLVPLSAHALFARPMVLSPRSRVRLDMTGTPDDAGVVWCDGYRSIEVGHGCRVEIDRSGRDLLIARLSEQPFATRLVKKFDLPVEGWRNRDVGAPGDCPDAASADPEGTEAMGVDDERADDERADDGGAAC